MGGSKTACESGYASTRLPTALVFERLNVVALTSIGACTNGALGGALRRRRASAALRREQLRHWLPCTTVGVYFHVTIGTRSSRWRWAVTA